MLRCEGKGRGTRTASVVEAHNILVEALGSDHAQASRVVGYLAELYDAWGKPEKTAEWRAKLADTEEEPASE